MFNNTLLWTKNVKIIIKSLRGSIAAIMQDQYFIDNYYLYVQNIFKASKSGYFRIEDHIDKAL